MAKIERSEATEDGVIQMAKEGYRDFKNRKKTPLCQARLDEGGEEE